MYQYRANGKWYQCDMSLYEKTLNVNLVQNHLLVSTCHQEMMDFYNIPIETEGSNNQSFEMEVFSKEPLSVVRTS